MGRFKLLSGIERLKNSRFRIPVRTTSYFSENRIFLIIFIKNRVKLIFLLANKNLDQLSNEASSYDDILAGDFLDSFHNLTFKDSMLMTWAKERCPSKFIFKGDDDILLNPYGQGYNYIFDNKINAFCFF